MARLIGAQRLILQAIQDSPKDVAGFVTDVWIAQVTNIALNELRDWLETLEGEGYVDLAGTNAGKITSMTAKGRLALSPINPRKQKLPTPHPSASGSEEFCVSNYAALLDNRGSWSFDRSKNTWTGEGEGSYLLSYGEYGQTSFTIQAKLAFERYQEFEDRGLDTANAGIVIGWNDDYQYYGHVLLNGKNVSYELVDHANPYTNFIPNVAVGRLFQVEEHRTYNLMVRLSRKELWVSIDGTTMLLFDDCSIQSGKVGLRPWRSQLTCKAFKVF